MRALVEELCSERCAGRAPGTPGGREARALVKRALEDAGLEAREQALPACGGANLVAMIPGDVDRWVLVGAHYDHLGARGRVVYHGADDNAAAVAILVETARGLARERAKGRGVIIAAFDAEEPPHFLSGTMGSTRFAEEPPVALDRIDMMVCMDLVGHAFGGEDMPAEVKGSLFALGAERSEGTGAIVDELARAKEGLVLRRADAEIIPPLSDYWAFWERKRPFLFLTSGRWRHYHTPTDTPEKLDYGKMASTARWLDRFVRATAARDDAPIRFQGYAGDDASTLRSLIEITSALSAISPEAEVGRSYAEALLAGCNAEGRLPKGRRHEVQALVQRLEERLA